MTEDSRPTRVPPRVRSAPRIRQIYWCDFPEDAQLPEFSKRRPVVIMSKSSKIHGCVTVLPLTTKSQPDNPMACPVIKPGEQAAVMGDLRLSGNSRREQAASSAPCAAADRAG